MGSKWIVVGPSVLSLLTAAVPPLCPEQGGGCGASLFLQSILFSAKECPAVKSPATVAKTFLYVVLLQSSRILPHAKMVTEKETEAQKEALPWEEMELGFETTTYRREGSLFFLTLCLSEDS